MRKFFLTHQSLLLGHIIFCNKKIFAKQDSFTERILSMCKIALVTIMKRININPIKKLLVAFKAHIVSISFHLYDLYICLYLCTRAFTNET